MVQIQSAPPASPVFARLSIKAAQNLRIHAGLYRRVRAGVLPSDYAVVYARSNTLASFNSNVICVGKESPRGRLCCGRSSRGLRPLRNLPLRSTWRIYGKACFEYWEWYDLTGPIFARGTSTAAYPANTARGRDGNDASDGFGPWERTSEAQIPGGRKLHSESAKVKEPKLSPRSEILELKRGFLLTHRISNRLGLPSAARA
jgi:hypothetical protein